VRGLRVLGIDPGTKTFDVVVLEDGVVRAEKSVDTATIAENPDVLVDVVEALEADYIVAPSGYGVPVTKGSEVLNPRRFAIELLLLSTEEDIKRGVKAGEVGIWVYEALAKVVEYLVRKYGGRVLFLPSIILLPTVPKYRKFNKLDMGTVDKLAATFLAVYDFSLRESLDYSDVNIVVVELGFGYNAVIAVSNGEVVDGIGGTYASIGTLTAGSLDLEVVVRVGSWDRWDVFHGGIFYYTNTFDMNILAKAYENGEEPLASVFKGFIEAVSKDVMRALVTSPKAEAVVLTGRHSRVGLVKKLLQEFLKDVEVIYAQPLKGAVISKEGAQGYAAIGEGVIGGYFRDLVKHMRIEEACGTVADYLIHEKLRSFREKIQSTYRELVTHPKLCVG
jgi:predicted butyrate kinase (DUF1464 family)